MQRWIYRVAARLLLLLTLACAAVAQGRADNSFDYFLLSLSWAPDFCALPTGAKDPRECGPGRRVGFVVHGLWPQREQSRGPERCAPARPVRADIVDAMLSYIPAPGLIQHEWSIHGVCAAPTPAEFFATVRKARDAVKIPPELQAPSEPQRLSPSEIEAKFAAANPRFPPQAFRVTCAAGALAEVRVCMAKDLSPRACSPSVGECRQTGLLIRPVR